MLNVTLWASWPQRYDFVVGLRPPIVDLSTFSGFEWKIKRNYIAHLNVRCWGTAEQVLLPHRGNVSSRWVKSQFDKKEEKRSQNVSDVKMNTTFPFQERTISSGSFTTESRWAGLKWSCSCWTVVACFLSTIKIIWYTWITHHTQITETKTYE